MSHANLNKICNKLGIKTSCQAGPPASYRFTQKFMPEEVTEPDPADLKTMVIVAQLYNNTVMDKPVYAVALHNKIKKADSNTLNLPQNICEGVDADALLNEQRENGLVMLAIANSLKTSFVNGLSEAIPKLEVQPNDIPPIVDDLVRQMSKVHEKLLSLPNIFPAM